MNVLIAIEVAILVAVIIYGYFKVSSILINIRKIEREYYIRTLVIPALPETMQRLARASYRLRLSARAAGVSVEDFNRTWRALCVDAGTAHGVK